MTFPKPVVDVAIEPEVEGRQKMSTALGRLSEEDPTFRVRPDGKTSQTVISGMGSFTSKSSSTRMKRSSAYG